MPAPQDNSIDHARSAFAQGNHAAAEAIARDLLVRGSANLDAHEILFLCLQARGDLSGAEAILRRAIELAPAKQWPRGDLARLLLSGGRTADAEHVLAEAVAADPSHADAHAMFGALLSEREMLVPGERHLRHAIRLAGRHPQLLANLGRNLMRQGKLDEAEPLLQAAVNAAPATLAPLVHLAELAELKDQFDRAAALLDQAEPLARREGRDVLAQRAHLLSRTPRWREGLALLDPLPNLSGTPLLLRARLRDRAGRFAEAWADAISAKAQLATARRHHYDAAAVQQEFAALSDLSDRIGEIAPAPLRKGVPQPIFILGFPRSGTTLTEQVLASHSRIRPGGELPFVAMLPAFLSNLAGAPFPAALSILETRPGIATELRDFYLRQADTYGLLDEGADFFTDKMPLNEVYLPLLRLAFPQSPLISVQRDPRDVIVSAMQHDMTHGYHCTYKLEDAADHLAAVARLTDHYRSAGIQPHCFRYESFVTDQQLETERLMRHVGLSPEPRQLAFHQSRRHAPTPSYAQVREPLHGRALGRWRNHADMLEPILDRLAAAISTGGY